MDTNTTRRQLLRIGTSAAAYAAGAAIVAGGVAIAGEARGESADAAAWDAGLRQIAHAKAEADAFTPHYARAHAAMEADLPSGDAIQWGRFPFTNKAYLIFDADLDAMADNIRKVANGLPGDGQPTWLGDYRRSLDAIEQIRALRAERAAVYKRHNIDALYEESERLCSIHYELEWKQFRTPSPHLRALQWKAEHLFGRETRGSDGELPQWSDEVMDVFTSDLARMAGEA